jgi:hypothetical protein
VTAAEALRRHEGDLLRLPGVAGVGVGQDGAGKEVIVVFARSDVDDLGAMRTHVPEELDGYRTDIRPEIRVFPGRKEGGTGNGN